MGLVQALHFCALSHIVNHWQDVTTTEQLNQVVHKTLLQLKLNGWTILTVGTRDSTKLMYMYLHICTCAYINVSTYVPISVEFKRGQRNLARYSETGGGRQGGNCQLKRGGGGKVGGIVN